MDFQQLKQQQDEWFKQIRRELREHSHTKKGRRLFKQVREAIDGTGLETAIDACDGYSSKCGSIFCEGCCDRKIEHLRKTLADHFNQSYRRNEEAIRSNGRYVTVLQGIVGVQYDDVDASIAAVEAAVDELRKNLKRVRRLARDEYRKSLWMRGTIHLEMLNYEDWIMAASFGAETAKQATLRGFMDITNLNSDRQILVHAHLVVDTNGMMGKDFMNIWDRVFNRAVRQNHRQQFYRYVKRDDLINKHSRDDAWKGMARYGYNWGNARLKFADNWGSGKNKEVKKSIDEYLVEVMDDNRTETKLNIRDIQFLVRAYDVVSGSKNKGLSLEWRS